MEKTKSFALWALGIFACFAAFVAVMLSSGSQASFVSAESESSLTISTSPEKPTSASSSAIVYTRPSTGASAATFKLYVFGIIQSDFDNKHYIEARVDGMTSPDESYSIVCNGSGYDGNRNLYGIVIVSVKSVSNDNKGDENAHDLVVEEWKMETETGSSNTKLILVNSGTRSIKLNNPESNVWQQIQNLISSNGVLVSIFTVCAVVLVRTGLNVFRFGVKYKSNFVTVEDNDKFKEEMRADARANKADMQDSILKICLREIARDTKPVAEMQQLAQDLKTSKEMNDLQIKNIQGKYNEIQTLSTELQNLEKTVRSIQYGETATGERRSGK